MKTKIKNNIQTYEYIPPADQIAEKIMGQISVDNHEWITVKGDSHDLLFDIMRTTLSVSDQTDDYPKYASENLRFNVKVFSFKKCYEKLLDKTKSPYIGEGVYNVIGLFRNDEFFPLKIRIEFAEWDKVDFCFDPINPKKK